MEKRSNMLLVSHLLFFVAVVADILTKEWALHNLMYKTISVCKGLNVSLVFNRGITWGLLSFRSDVAFHILTALIFVVVLLFIVHTFYVVQRCQQCVFFEFLILAGAFSNLLDRLLHQGVVDFIDVYIGSFHWAIFNLADAYVVVGVIGILIRFFIPTMCGKTFR
jgi:signal peptidase II